MNKFFLIPLLLFYFFLPKPTSAQDGSFCANRAESYPQCGGTLGLEGKPEDETFWVTRYVNCREESRYESSSLGKLGQCPQCVPQLRKYSQCGGTLGLENFPRNHTVEISEITDPQCKKYYLKENQGDLGGCPIDSRAITNPGESVATIQVEARGTAPIPPPAPVSEDRDPFAWNKKINPTLQNRGRVFPGSYNQLLSPFTSKGYTTGIHLNNTGFEDATLYWCTYSIVDAFRLAGKPSLGKTPHGAVGKMRGFWRDQGPSLGYIYFDYKNRPLKNQELLRQVKPGYVLFIQDIDTVEYTYNAHVNMVKEISINQRGDGHVQTLDSNATVREDYFPISSYIIQSRSRMITGIGGY